MYENEIKKVTKIDNVDIDLRRRDKSLEKTINEGIKSTDNNFDNVLKESIEEIKKSTSNIYIPKDLGNIKIKK